MAANLPPHITRDAPAAALDKVREHLGTRLEKTRAAARKHLESLTAESLAPADADEEGSVDG